MKKLIGLGLAGAAAALVVGGLFESELEPWEWKTLDLRFSVRKNLETTPHLIMIDADKPSAERYGRWPWKRSVHTRMIRFLKSENVAVIAYDILFEYAVNVSEDEALARAAADAGNVIFPIVLEPSTSPGAVPKTVLKIPGTLPRPPNHPFPKARNNIHLPIPSLIQSASGLGHIATNRDKDGMVRRTPLLIQYGDQLVPSLGFQTVLKFLKVDPANIEIRPSSILLKQVQDPSRSQPYDIEIPVDSQGQMLINYAGQWTKTFKHASFAEVLATADQPQHDEESAAGKIILVSIALSGKDLKTTPLEKTFPGGGIHANIMNTILTGNFLKETPWGVNALLVLMLSLVTAMIFNHRNYVSQVILVFSVMIGYGALAILLFNAGYVVLVITPLMAGAITTLMVTIYQANREKGISGTLAQEKNRLQEHLQSILQKLEEKTSEVDRIRSELATANQGLEQKGEAWETHSRKIAELEQQVTQLDREKEKLAQERSDLKRKVTDVNFYTFSRGKTATPEKEDLIRECRECGIITQSPAMLEIFNSLKQIAAVPSAVLIQGESGTGKELIAQAIHRLSPRKNEKFVAVNMGAIPRELVESELFGHSKGAFTGAIGNKKGKFMLAHRGSIFLDEIGEMSLDIQVKILRTLQMKEVEPVGGEPVKVDARVISATNKQLEKEIENKQFREDLFYRLNTLEIELPPLRERPEDLEVLVQYFLKKFSAEYGKPITGISEASMDLLKAHSWPGNVRELENVVQRGITLAKSEMIQEYDLGLKQTASESPRPAEINSDEVFLEGLRNNNFEINAAAKQFNMSRNTVSSRFKGICFDLLVQHQGDRDHVADAIAPHVLHRPLVHQRVVEYHDNLIATARSFQDEDAAVQAALKRGKNVPKQYHPAMEELVRHCFSMG